MELKTNDNVSNIKLQKQNHSINPELSFEQNRCHEPQLALAVNYHNHIYNDLHDSQRIYVNDLIFKIWDVYQPTSMDSNCGKNSGGMLHWKFNYDQNAYREFMNDMIKQEKDNTNKQVIRDHFDHYLRTHKEWLSVKHRDQLEQIQNDIQQIEQLFPRVQYTNILILPSKEKLIKQLGDISFDKSVRFSCENNLHELHPQSTSLRIQIQTKIKKHAFKMINWRDRVNNALKTFLTLNEITAKTFNQYISSIYTKNDIEIKWFELIVKTESSQNGVVIVIQCQVTVLHYLLMMLYKFKYNYVKKWFQKYMNVVQKELKNICEGTKQIAVCVHSKHCILTFEQNAKKLSSYKYVGTGTKNKQIVTMSYIKQNKNANGYNYNYNSQTEEYDIENSIHKLNLSSCNNNNEYKNNKKHASRYKGKFTKYNFKLFRKQGFGFITMEDGSAEIYVHKSAMKAYVVQQHTVEFDIELENNGNRKAINVTRAK